MTLFFSSDIWLYGPYHLQMGDNILVKKDFYISRGVVFKNIFANQLIIHILILICTYVSFCRWEGPQRTETNEHTPFSQKALLFTMEHMWQLFQLNICVCGALFMTICARKMLSDSQLVPTTVDSPRTSVSLPLHHFSSSPNTTGLHCAQKSF